MGKVTLLGAGPGDAGLITVKGLEKLKTCDVVVYDRLASEELLNVVKEDCVLVYVGKKPGAHSMVQEEINQVLVEYGRNYGEVVRLKGGDPFVFGRGGEEIMALQQAGIPCEVIPGITSSIAVPELAGIPVTHRGVSRSFHVITGHTGDGLHTKDAESTMTEDYETLAKLEGTLVFLMGLSNLEKIAKQLLRYGKAADTPAAVIAKGTTPQEEVVRGTLSDIHARVRQAGLESPVVIVIGETAAFHFKLEGSSEKHRYGVIGTARTMENFRQTLKGRAGDAVKTIPLLEMQVCNTEQIRKLEEELAHISDYNWVLFTSKQAVEVFFKTFYGKREDIRKLAGCRFGVIGQGTFDALAEYGIHADFVPRKAEAESFACEFSEKIALPSDENRSRTGRVKVLLPRAGQGNPLLGEILTESGMEVCEILTYDVVGKCCRNFSQVTELTEFVFFSASGVRAFFAELAERGMHLPSGSRCYCIGALTRRALEMAIAESNSEKFPAADDTVRDNAGVHGMDTEGVVREHGASGIWIVTAGVQSVEGLAEKIAEDF